MDVLLNLHNYERRLRESCIFEDIVPAEEKLDELTWDNELAADAQRFADQCKEYVKQSVRSVGKWESVGQNAIEVTEIADAVRLWTKEANYYNHSLDTCMAGHDCDSYKQMVQAETKHIGCGAKWCIDIQLPLNFLVVCNYSPAVRKGQPYKEGRCLKKENI
ncbi:Venom allergen 5 [Schistosoma japonicum]|nr:Venom allergen 5 [Schistosoma japonicum]